MYTYVNRISSLNVFQNLMRKNNPVVIPRNHLVDDAIKKTVNGNTDHFNRLLKIYSASYQYEKDWKNS